MPLRWKRRRSLIQLRCRVWATNEPNMEVDFAGRAEYGVCSSKALKYFGLKLHSVVSLTGVVMGFVLTGASHYDNQAVVELLDSFAHHLKHLLGDGAYNDAALQTFLEQYRCVELLAPLKVHHQPIRCKQARTSAQSAAAHLRNKCMPRGHEQLHWSKHSAKITWGLLT